VPGAAPVLLKQSAVDTIIQSSTVEILRSYEITVAPRARSEVIGHVPSSDVVGIIAFEGPNIAGNLAVPTSVCHPAMPRRARNTTHAEWTYEITNQVMGSIKNRLIQFQVRLRTHVPTVLSGVALERHKRRTAVEVLYCFAALRGDVSLMVDASLARASLEYSNAALVVSDNDPLLFG
jgi:CheY-specific phosphatase CheX